MGLLQQYTDENLRLKNELSDMIRQRDELLAGVIEIVSRLAGNDTAPAVEGGGWSTQQGDRSHLVMPQESLPPAAQPHVRSCHTREITLNSGEIRRAAEVFDEYTSEGVDTVGALMAATQLVNAMRRHPAGSAVAR